MNLREDKHWAYGSYSSVSAALGQRPWMAFAAVQIDKTAESLKEMRREIGEYATGKAPPKQEEVAKIQASEIRSLPGSYETAGSVLGTLAGIVRFGRPDDYVFRRKAEIEGLTVDQVKAAAAAIDPDALTWVVVGDLKQIEKPVRDLKLGEVTIVDADGKPVGK
jgi:predicted Zn-dependent peptidase